MVAGIILGGFDDDSQPIYALLAFGSLSTSNVHFGFLRRVPLRSFRDMPCLITPFDTMCFPGIPLVWYIVLRWTLITLTP